MYSLTTATTHITQSGQEKQAPGKVSPTYAGLVSSKLSDSKSLRHRLIIGRHVLSSVLSFLTISSSCAGLTGSSLPPNAAMNALRFGMAESDSGNTF